MPIKPLEKSGHCKFGAGSHHMVVISRAVFVTLVVLFCTTPLFADGYRNVPEGARSVGAFGGHRAFADDANANIHNSANLVDLEQPMIQINTTFGYGRNEFHGTGGSDKTENPFVVLPGFSAAMPFKDGKYAVGLSSYIAYGRSVDWGDADLFATTPVNPSPGSPTYPYKGSMMVADFTPNFAMRLTDSLSFGIGADIYYGTVKQYQYIAPGLRSKLTADGNAIGWNASMTWKITERQRLAATYRSPFSIKYKGDNHLTGMPDSDASAKIEYPAIVGLAYGIEFTDTFRAEVDGEWLDFSQYEKLTVNDSQLGTTTAAQSLKDTWTVGIGTEWDFLPQWTLRSGFMYLENPTPEQTYSSLGPDTDQGVVSIGLGYETEHHAVDVGYAIGIFNGRNVRGSSNSPDGKYDYSYQVLSLSYGYKF
jgi:long-chain fatty acid transport protein